MIRILYLIDNLDTPKAGTEKQLMKTIEILDRRRFECTLMTLASSPWMLDAELPCPWENLDAGPLIRPRMLSVARRFTKVCRSRKIQILQTFFSDSNVIGPLLAKLAGVAVVIGSRRNIGYMHKRKDLWALRFARRFTTHIIANSKAAAHTSVSLEGFDPARVSVIPNMLDVDAFARSSGQEVRNAKHRWGFPEKTIVVGAVANLRPVKNLGFLIQAAAILTPRFPNVRFVVLGEGSERLRLQRQIDAARLGSVFALPGLSTQVSRDVASFDIGVLVSHSESSPNSLLEYMAAGKASVVSDVGGVREIVVHERLALVFPQGDLGALVRNLERLLLDTEMRTQIGRRAQDHVVSVYDQGKVIRSLEDLYIKLIEVAK